MAKADVTINAETPLVLPGLTFGALVRTAPAIDRIWGNVGVGFGSTWLAQVPRPNRLPSNFLYLSVSLGF